MKTWFCGSGVLLALLIGFVAVRAADSVPKLPYTTWSDYGGSADSMQYSALKQIDKTNVAGLELAWSHPAPGPSGRFAFGPLIVDDVMYVAGKDNSVVALDAASGKQLWSRAAGDVPTNRGFNYWESKDRSERRILFAANSFLRAIDARTGEFIESFGKAGRVDLREGIPRAANIQSGTPGRVFENLLILGSATGESYASAPGDLRAFDVRSGKLVWAFHTIPHPGEFGYDTWPKDAWQYVGGANTWGEISVDEKRGIVYFPTGSPTFDLYGGDRLGANLFGNCLLALDARTGKRLWHYQLVHHDLWDYDLVTAPKLMTVRHNGKMLDVVAQASKTGMLYVFDRVTGQPLWPIEERPVPRSDVPGEEAWPTQPFTTKPPPFARLEFKPDDLNPYLDAEERRRLREILVAARNEGIFTPPALTRQFIVVPGQHGGANFGAAAGDPETGMVYVRSIDVPGNHQLRLWDPSSVRAEGETPEERGLSVYAQVCQPCHGDAQAKGIPSFDRATIISIKELGPERVRMTIRQGQGQMPAFPSSRLSGEHLESLQAYLANPAAAPGPARIPPPLPLSKDQVRYTGPLGSRLLAKNGLPAIAPPWASIVAYDLNDGTIKWRAPLGTFPELAAKGIKDTGNFNRIHRNGLVVTAGGLLFAGSYGDRTVRAFDKATGRIVWEKELPGGPEGMPAIYEVRGRQYVAFYASATSEDENKPVAQTQGYYVFALPRAAERTTVVGNASNGDAKRVKLFDGKTLTGWNGNPAFWSVVDGAIHGVTDQTKGELILTDGDYESFRLILKSRLVSESNHLGVCFWGERKTDWTYGNCVLVIPPNGGMWDYHPGKKSPPRETLAKPGFDPRAWHESEILANIKTGAVRMAVNGVELIRYTDEDPARLRKGPIGLQIHSGASIVEYKDIEVEVDPKDNRLVTVRDSSSR